MTTNRSDADQVSQLLGHCLEDRAKAEALFQALGMEKTCRVSIEGRDFELTEEERGEFVERFSAEIEPTLWESKRRKDQI